MKYFSRGINAFYWCLLVAFLLLPQDVAAFNKYEHFFDDLYANKEIVLKWNKPIRYHVIGLSAEEVLNFDRFFCSVANRVGLTAVNVDNDINTFFMFTNNFINDVNRSNVKKIFQNNREYNVDRVENAIRKLNRNSIEYGVVYLDRYSITNIAIISNVGVGGLGLKYLMCRSVFFALTGVGAPTSLDIESIKRKEIVDYSELKRIDLAFIKVLYMQNVMHGQGLASIKKYFVAQLAEQMEF